MKQKAVVLPKLGAERPPAPDSPPAGESWSSGKWNWKVLEGDWVWIPLDEKGVPLTETGAPVLPRKMESD